jgi:3-oxoadipate enol-lactonase
MDFRDSIPFVRSRLLVIGGLHDWATPPVQCYPLAAAIPGCELAWLDTALLSNMEMPEAISVLVHNFLAFEGTIAPML